MPAAEPGKVAEQLRDAFDIDKESCIPISAKTGTGIEDVLKAIVERLKPPDGMVDGKTRLLMFDAYHDEYRWVFVEFISLPLLCLSFLVTIYSTLTFYRGVVSLVLVVDGKIRKGDKVVSKSSGESWEVLELGFLTPDPQPANELHTGQVGYVLTGMKNTRSAKIGDTWHIAKQEVEALSGFREPKPMVFAGIFPVGASEFDLLQAAMHKLTLNDASVVYRRENSNALGAGFRCGFLGLLHMDVFRQRLEQEHGATVIITAPTVPIKVYTADKSCIELQNPSEFPTNQRIIKVEEPTVLSTIILPSEMLGSAMTLCQERRGEMMEHTNLSSNRVMLRYVLPLAELGGDFYDELKSLSSGYASFDYEEGEYRAADLVRMDVLVNGDPIDALARVVHRSRAEKNGRSLCENLKRLMERQQYDIALQAAAGGRIVARETVKAYRKNVLAKCYGGDITRKKKLLEKQKEGKKRMRRLGMT